MEEIVRDFEWTRIIPMVLSVLAIIQLAILYNKTHNFLCFAPMAWVVLVLIYEVFKYIVDGDLRYYTASVILNSFIFITGLILLIVTLFAYRDYTYVKLAKKPDEK